MLIELTKDGLNAHHRRQEEDVLLHDRINEAYRGELGEAFQAKTKKRIDWIIANIRGKRVLDIGCSQGIVPIILGEKGISVVGVDIDQKVIDDANLDLGNYKDAQKNVNFVCQDFMKYKPKEKFDTVIFTELLEHLYDPELFIERAFEVTELGGRIVITSPFGINDHPDHRQNFYLLELYQAVSKYYEVEEVAVIEKWIGVIGTRRIKKTKPSTPPVHLLASNEQAFYSLERNLVDKVYQLEDANKELRENLKEARQKLRVQWRKTERFYNEVGHIRNSYSYKAGRAITYPARQLYKLPLIERAAKRVYRFLLPGRVRIAENKPTRYSDLFKPHTPARSPLNKLPADVKMAVIMDEFTYESFKYECNVEQLRPEDWKKQLSAFQPDLLFVESAWRGVDGLWTNQLPSVPDELVSIVSYCNKRNIPTIFWNKEDPAHTTHFIKTASLFDYVFTTDTDSIPFYQRTLLHNRVYLLPFAAQPKYNNPIEKYERLDKFNFAGSYYRDYVRRCADFEQIVKATLKFKGLDIYDRNFGKNLPPKYQYPEHLQQYIQGTLPYSEIDKAYKGYKYAITLNTIKYSHSMFARRALELLASNTVTVGNYSKGMINTLGELVGSSDNAKDITHWLERNTGDDIRESSLRLLGVRKVLSEHTYQERLGRILSVVFENYNRESVDPQISVVAYTDSDTQLKAVLQNYQRQAYANSRLFIIHSKKYIPKSGNYTCFESTETDLITKVTSNAKYVAHFNPGYFYGKNYLTDLAIAVTYSEVDIIGKSSYFKKKRGKLYMTNSGEQYHTGTTITLSHSMLKSIFLKNIKTSKYVEFIRQDTSFKSTTLSIDGYNLCDDLSISNSEKLVVEGLLDDIDTGMEISNLYSYADRITSNRKALNQGRLQKIMRSRTTQRAEQKL